MNKIKSFLVVLVILILIPVKALAAGNSMTTAAETSAGITIGSYVVFRTFSDKKNNLANILAAAVTGTAVVALQNINSPKAQSGAFLGSFVAGIGLCVVNF